MLGLFGEGCGKSVHALADITDLFVALDEQHHSTVDPPNIHCGGVIHIDTTTNKASNDNERKSTLT